MTFEERLEEIHVLVLLAISLGLITETLSDNFEEGTPDELKYREFVIDQGMEMYSNEETYMWGSICDTLKVQNYDKMYTENILEEFRQDFHKKSETSSR